MVMSFERIRKRILDEFDRLEKEIEATFTSIMEEALGILYPPKPMWSPEGTLEPLINIREYDDKYTIIVDLPYANLNTLSIDAKGKSITIKCLLKKRIKFDRWSTLQHQREFYEYKKTVVLPDDADTLNFKVVKRRECMVVIEVPKRA